MQNKNFYYQTPKEKFDGLGKTATEFKNEALSWYNKIISKFAFADSNWQKTLEAMEFIKLLKNTTSEDILPRRTFVKADDWFNQIKDDYARVNSKREFVRNSKKVIDTYPNDKGKMKDRADALHNDYDFVEKHEKQMKNKRERLEGEKSFFGKTWDAIKTVVLSGGRGLFLLAIRLNVKNLATIFKFTQAKNKDGYNNLVRTFEKFGGQKSKFENAINEGWNKKPLLDKKMNTTGLSGLGFYNNLSGTEEKTLSLPNGMGLAVGSAIVGLAPTPPDPVSKGTLSTQASIVAGIIEAMTTIINQLKIKIPSGEPTEDGGGENGGGNNGGGNNGGGNNGGGNGGGGDDDEGINRNIIIAGIVGLLGIAGIILFSKKNKK